ncbi:tdg mug dna glycosylase [Naviculisporaceae sp. PSN 640]
MEDSTATEVAPSKEEGTPPPPSFTGRLKIQDFMFKSGTTTAATVIRRSPRLSTTPTTSPVPISSSSINKRKSTTPSRTGTNENSNTTKLSSRSPSPTKRPKLAATRSSPSTSPRKRPSTPSSYAPPSKYAHLPHLPDAILPNLLILFIGLNPGIETARTGHAYAHPTNLFWRLLYSSGVTPRLVSPTEDRNMPRLYQLGLTNIVSRPSRNGAELSKQEMDDGVEILEEKVRKYRPESVCIVGKSIWESLWRVRHGRGIKKEEFRYGWQEESENMGVIKGGGGDGGEWKGARVFVATSTSGLAATLKPHEKEAVWRELGGWVERRREEMKEGNTVVTPPGVVD